MQVPLSACRCRWNGEAAPSGINENSMAERQCQASSVQSVAHHACCKQSLRGSRERVACRRVSSFSQSVVTQSCLLAPGVEHGLPPLLLKVLQAWRETQLAAATLGNASLQCATPACTALARPLQAALSSLNLRLCSRPDEPHFALMALSIGSRLRRSH